MNSEGIVAASMQSLARHSQTNLGMIAFVVPRVWCVLVLLLGTSCESMGRIESESAHRSARELSSNAADEPPRNGQPDAAPAPEAGSSQPTSFDPGAIRVEALDGTQPPVFVVRGRGLGPDKLVFLHGMCGHGQGYAQSFQHASARKGRLIAPQADVPCGDGPWAKWSMDVRALDARITEAFVQLGEEEPVDNICAIGMSQGATRAAALARTFPERYTRLISMGAPTEVNPAGLEGLRGAVLMVGERERKDLMLTSERKLRKAGVPAHSLIIPDADHAGMGPTPEQTMGTALDWLWENSRLLPDP